MSPRISLLRRGLDCLLGASFVYGLMLLTTSSHLHTDDRSISDQPAYGKHRSSPMEHPQPTDSRSALAAAAAAVAAAEVLASKQPPMDVVTTAKDKLSALQQQEQQLAAQSPGPVAAWTYADAKSCVCPTPVPPQSGTRYPLTVDDVAFGVLTSERFLETRLSSQQRTWLRRVRHVVFYSESEVRSIPTLKLVPPAKEELVGGGAWKNFPALIDLSERFPLAKWVFFNDDDTYIFVENLLQALGKFDYNRDYYVGLYWTPRIDMEWREVHIAYASGGAGYALSRALLTRMTPRMSECHGNYTRWAGDVRVGKCVVDMGIHVTPAVGFHHEGHDKYTWDSSGGGFPYGHLSNRASAAQQSPVTFHHLTVDQIAMYNRMQLCESRGPHGELYRYDFAPYFLKEYISYVPSLQRRFRFLFGISLEVGETPGPSNSAWRKDFSDPIYLHMIESSVNGIEEQMAASILQEDESPRRFEMVISKVPEIFNGDGCDAGNSAVAQANPRRQPIRKSALIEIICRRCVPADAVDPSAPAEFNKICAVKRADDCTLHVVLSLMCPPRQIVYAPTLDVGTAPGSRDVITAGAPASCGGGGGGGGGGGAVKAPPVLAWPPRGAAATSTSLHVSLTYGHLAIGAPDLSVLTNPATSKLGCSATLDAEGPLRTGGVLRAIDGPSVMRIRCVCEAAVQPTPVNLTLTMRLHEHTSPIVSFPHLCRDPLPPNRVAQ